MHGFYLCSAFWHLFVSCVEIPGYLLIFSIVALIFSMFLRFLMLSVDLGNGGKKLILIDGMEGDLTTITPQDIESISVLKDAAASSIYGSRAPFGVILVTTKSGKTGRAQVNYNMNVRFQTPLNMPEMANSWEFVNLFDEAEFNNSGNHLYETDYMQQVKDYIQRWEVILLIKKELLLGRCALLLSFWRAFLEKSISLLRLVMTKI